MIKQNLFKGKTVKDYEMGQTLVTLEGNCQMVQATKAGIVKVTICPLKKSQINPQKFVAYNNALAENQLKIYPNMIELIQSQTYIYIIFEHLRVPFACGDADQTLKRLQLFFKNEKQKIQREQILIKEDLTLCYVPSYFKAMSPTSIYGQIHNKNVLASIFCEVVENSSKQKVTQILLNHWDNPQIMKMIEPLVISYPSLQDEDSQIMALMSGIKVNPGMMKQASQQYMRTSSRRNQQEQSSKQIGNIVDDVKSSMFEIKLYKDSTKKTRFQLKLNQKKFQQAQFQIFFEGYTQIFKLFKKTIKSYLTKYSKGFTGVITSYMITLIGILRRLQLICDLQAGVDIFSLGMDQNYDYTKYLASLKKQLLSEGKMLVNLKEIIQSSNMPMRTYETLMPYLDNIQNVDRVKAQNFCFFFMTIIMRQRLAKQYHFLLSIQVISVLLHRNYEITYCQEDFPKTWDSNQFEIKKTLIEAAVPNWFL